MASEAGSREGNTGREPKFPLYRLSLLLNTCPGGRDHLVERV